MQLPFSSLFLLVNRVGEDDSSTDRATRKKEPEAMTQYYSSIAYAQILP